MRRYRNGSFSPQTPKQRIHIRIGKWLARARTVQFDEEMIGFDVDCMHMAYVGYNLINEIKRNINGTKGVDGFDLRPIFQRTAIMDREAIFSHIHILYPES